MNEYLKNLNKIEFVVTYACTGKCKHCSEGDHAAKGAQIDASTAADAVRRVSALYPIKTVMTFGGEPLLFPETVCKIHAAATDAGVAKRQIITNGYFSKDRAYVAKVAADLEISGVNEILLSVDAFHQETIPLSNVRYFAEQAASHSIPLKLQPAWLVSPGNDNPYNLKTREILQSFDGAGFEIGNGNVIFPEGNAKIYLAEYFTDSLPENPYVEDEADVRCLSFDPSGDVLHSNVYRHDILDIINEYRPSLKEDI